MSRGLKTVKSNPLAGKIKKVMQTDEDVGKIAQGAPVLMSRAMELFLSKLCAGTAAIANRSHARTVTPSHLKAYVTSDGKMDFLTDKLASVPDFAEEESVPAKKQRTEAEPIPASPGSQVSPGSSPAGGKAARGRGRGRTRGRGSVRISADDTRSQIKAEQDDAEPAQAVPNLMDSQEQDGTKGTHLFPDNPTQAEAECNLADVGVPAVQADNTRPMAADLQISDMINNAATKEQSAANPQTVVKLSTVGRLQQRPAAIVSNLQEPAQSLHTAQTHAIPEQTSTATLTLPATQSKVLAEEDDYDADD